ncbi:hypothetical protein IV55_GL000301 [Furfurilactobacillus siliginis]|nr:hypothetical protein IV55_GL000301 [Furfurilactobacillus siliginis]
MGAIAALVIPACIFLVLLISLGIEPFGDKTIAYIDANNQYMSFFGYLKQNLTNPTGFLYSFQAAIGNNFFGVLTYYLLNPINVLIIFFPLSKMPLFLLVLAWLKISLASLSMYYFLRVHFRLNLFKTHLQNHLRMIDVLVGTTYSFMAFAVVYMSNVMWLDVLILLPLMVLGLEKIFNGNKPYLFGAVLTYGLITNYYTSYISCFFLAFYFLFLILLSVQQHVELQELIKHTISTIISGALGIGLAAVVLLPSFESTVGVAKAPVEYNLNFITNWVDLGREVLGGIPGTEPHVGPLIFTGSLMLIMIVSFFLNDNVDLKEKLSWGAMLLLILGLSNIDASYFAWHVFTAPNGFPHRESYTIGFFITLLAATSLHKGFSVSRRSLLKGLMLFGAALLVLSKVEPFITSWVIIYNVAIVVALCFSLHKWSGNGSSVALLAVILLSFGDVAYGARNSWKTNSSTLSSQSFARYTTSMAKAVKFVQQDDKSFYRVGVSTEQSTNQGMLFNYRGVGGYTSTQGTNLVNFWSSLGYFQNYQTRWVNYNNGSTLAIDNLFGIKYRIENNNAKLRKDFNAATSDLGYDNFPSLESKGHKVGDVDGLTIYKTTKSMPLAVSVRDEALAPTKALHQTKNPFEVQNRLWMKLTGLNKALLNIPDEITQSESTGRREISYVITPKQTGGLYLNLPEKKGDIVHQPLQMYVNGHFVSDYRTEGENGIVALGHQKTNQTVKVTVRAVDGAKIVGLNTSPNAYTQNEKVMLEGQARLNPQKKINVHLINSRRIRVNVPSAAKHLMLTIPYDKGWHAVDQANRPLKIKKAVGSMLGIETEASSKKTTLSYTPTGLISGIIISSSSLVATIAVALWYELKSSKRK